MLPARWHQVEEIFQNALDLPESEWKGYVDDACGDDSELKVEVERLLSQYSEASSFIETPVFSGGEHGVLSSLMHIDDVDPMIGTILGRYRIEREIGRGGMGAVYEAVRADGEFRRKAAIKVVKRGMDTDFILRRFRNERQILATLEHPYIARLLDGGTTDDGRPYFVMEHIEGLPLYRYSDKNRLTINERLNLFTKVCEAVEYAHQNLVIHRDLKPSNILVTPDGTPRLLDFGIAKLLDPDMAYDTLQPTATAMRMMTIDYASPEQINGEKVTYATDVYSLGVILFELLTGRRPYRFTNRTPHEVARVICNEQPLLPSSAISRSDESLPVIQVDQEAITIRYLAELRRETPEQLSRELRGNLDNITLKALRKIPTDRFESITKLRSDIESHLKGVKITAPQYVPPESVPPPPQSTHTGRLIAVLPLELLNFSSSETTDDNYLSIGLADAIIARLTVLQEFTVRPTSSISGYENKEIGSLQAGRELGVDFVLDGRIKRSADTLRVSLQLLDIEKNTTVWAGQFDEKFTDILALEDAISGHVVEALVTQITGEHRVELGKRGTDNPEAYEAYLKGRFYWNQFSSNSLSKAFKWFQRAVDLDPNYALAHVGVADFYIWANIYGLVPTLRGSKLAKESIQRALDIDDKLGEAYATYGLLKQNEFDWSEGERLHLRSIELNPNYHHSYEWYSACLVGSGRIEEGLKMIERCEELDPLSLRTKTLVAWTKYQAGKTDEALSKANEIIDLDGNYPQGHLQKGNILIELGRPEEAIREIEKGMELMSESALTKYYLCFALAAADRLKEARKIVEEMRSSPNYVKPMFLGLACLAAGEIDDAFAALSKAVDECDPWLVWFGTEPKLAPFRSDKRYAELLKRTKNPIYFAIIDGIGTPDPATRPIREKEYFATTSSFVPSFFRRHKFKLAAAACLMLLLVLGYSYGIIDVQIGEDRIRRGAIIDKQDMRSVVVLPFKNETSNTDNDYLAEGLSDNLTYTLSKSTAIRILSKAASVVYRGKTVEPKRIASELRSDFVVIGRLTRHDDSLAFVVEIFDAVNDKIVRTFEYSGKDDQLIDLQSRMAREVSRELGHSEGNDASAKSSTINTEAFEMYLKGEFHRQKSTPTDIKRSIEFYKKALELDANYALAYQGLAFSYRSSPAFGTLSPNEAYPQAKDAAMKALEIDPNLGAAHVPLASIKSTYEWDFVGAEKEYKLALQLAPNNSDAYLSYGNFLIAMGRTDEALAQLRTALQFDPLSANTATNIGWALYLAGRLDEAETQVKQVIAREPTFARAYMNLGEIYQERGRSIDAIAAFQRSKDLSGDVLADMALGHAYGTAGRKADAIRIAQDLEAKVLRKEASPFLPAVVYAGLNDKDKAFYWLERSYQERSNWLALAKVGLRLKNLRGDPRFDDLLKRIGF